MFSNVLSNAVKFTPRGGTITLDARADVEQVTVTVQDTGVGIAPEFLPYVFDRFRQADSRVNRAYGGLGLGLAIAQHLVRQHGGHIAAASDGPDRGTTIAIQLPAASLDVSSGAIGPLADEVHLGGLAVLVVDDEPDAREMLALLLEQRGARVLHGDGAAAALEILGREAVDLVIADIGMPDVDGYEFMRRLRGRGLATPAIALTAFAHQSDRQRCLDCGYTAFLAKPVDVDALARTLRHLVMSPAQR